MLDALISNVIYTASPDSLDNEVTTSHNIKDDYSGVTTQLTNESVDDLARKHGDEGGVRVGNAIDTCSHTGVVTIGVYYADHIGNPDNPE